MYFPNPPIFLIRRIIKTYSKNQIMDFEPKDNAEETPEDLEFAEPQKRKPLEILRDTEAFLRRPTVGAIVPIVSPELSKRIEEASFIAEDTLSELAEIDFDQISDWELRPARIKIGLSFVGFSALTILVLLLYLTTLHPELNPTQQIGLYWREYVWFVCLGVTGMFILGREAMRQVEKPSKSPKR